MSVSNFLILNSNDNFSEIIKNDIIIVYFFAKWCGPCIMFGPIYEQYAKKFPNIKFIKLDIDQMQDLSAVYMIKAVPTFIKFKNGEIISREEGVPSNFDQFINS